MSATLKKVIDSKDFEVFQITNKSDTGVKYIDCPISAGFPSPANDYLLEIIDLNKVLIKNKLSTFLFKAKGSSMIDAGIRPNDYILVDTSREPKNKEICICEVDGEYTLKSVVKNKEKFQLVPFNSEFKVIDISSENRFDIWGVLMYSIHKHYIGQ